MNRSEFERIDKAILSRLIDGQKQKYPSLILSENWRTSVFSHYESTREFVRTQMLNYQKAPFLIDRHKIAASMLWAVLKAEPFRLPDEGTPINLRLANEVVAFSVAVSILKSFRETEEKAKHQGAQSLVNFKLPDVDKGEKYVYHVYRALHQAAKHDKFEPFVWANLMFVLEKYNILYYQRK